MLTPAGSADEPINLDGWQQEQGYVDQYQLTAATRLQKQSQNYTDLANEQLAHALTVHHQNTVLDKSEGGMEESNALQQAEFYVFMSQVTADAANAAATAKPKGDYVKPANPTDQPKPVDPTVPQPPPKPVAADPNPDDDTGRGIGPRALNANNVMPYEGDGSGTGGDHIGPRSRAAMSGFAAHELTPNPDDDTGHGVGPRAMSATLPGGILNDVIPQPDALGPGTPHS